MFDWIQMIIALTAVLVAYGAYRVSKNSVNISKGQLLLNKSQHELSEATLKLNQSQYEIAVATIELSKQISYASHRCVIYPEKVSLNGGNWEIRIRNNGIGLAFNVTVQMYLRDRLIQTTDPIPMNTNGAKVINPQSEQVYGTIAGDLSLLIFQETPIIIRWEELSGIKNEAQWYWSANEYNDEKFSLKQHIRQDSL